MYPGSVLIHAARQRLFIALWPGSATRDALVAHARQWRWPPAARLTAAERMHITLHFIGDVAADRVDPVAARLDVGFEPFDLRLTQPEVWKGGIAVLCAEAIPPALVALHQRLAARLQDLALPVEQRPLRVHATLARKAQGAGLPPPADIDWPAREGYALVRSLPGGAGYRTLRTFA